MPAVAEENTAVVSTAPFLLRILTAAAIGLATVGIKTAVAGPALVFDANTGEVLAEQDAFHPWYPASLTKMMTAYVTFRAIRSGEISLDGPVTMTGKASKEPPSKMGFKPGTVITVDTALKILIVKSANDVAMALAESVAGSEAAFVDRMNGEAARLGMVGTRFRNPNGLPDPAQFTTARDFGLLAQAIIRDFPEYRGLFRITALSLGGKVIKSHNHLLERYPGTDGMKTGFICSSGFNVVASASRGGRRLVAVVLGEPNARDRAERTAALLEEGFTRGGGFFRRKTTLENLRPSGPVAASPADLREDICGKNRAKGEEADADVNDATRQTFLVEPFHVMDPVPIAIGGAAPAAGDAVTADQPPLPRPNPLRLGAAPVVAPAAAIPAFAALPPLDAPPIEILGLKDAQE